MFKDNVKCVPRKFQIKFQEFSRMFQWSFCNFIVAWISSQLPEQKEGLFTCERAQFSRSGGWWVLWCVDVVGGGGGWW